MKFNTAWGLGLLILPLACCDTVHAATPALIFRAGFDGRMDAVKSIAGRANPTGSPELIADGKLAGALELKPGQSVSFKAEGNLSATGGTIMFWLKPRWDRQGALGHTMVSLSWKGTPQSYFCFSDGWWEPAGRKRVYFVRNNQEHSYVSRAVFLPFDTWCHVALAWKNGAGGYVKFYVNGRQRGGIKNRKVLGATCMPVGEIVFGSDSGAVGEHRGRFAPGVYDEIRIYDGPMSGAEIEKEFKQQASDWQAVRSAYIAARNRGKSKEQIAWEASVTPALAGHPAFTFVKHNPKLPNVLIVGDSISIGYTVAVRTLLKGKANVYRIPANGGPTTRGLANFQKWFMSRKWDVIHFNWGLHDCAYLNWDVRSGKQRTSLDEYRGNLEVLVARLQRTGAMLIWASTTPIPEGAKGNRKGDAVRYNQVAEAIMRKHGIRINDLYTYVLPVETKYQRPQNIHFTDEGYRFLGKKVADAINQSLKASSCVKP